MKNEKELSKFIVSNFNEILISKGVFSTNFKDDSKKIIIRDITTIESLDKELMVKKYDLLVMEIPFGFGKNFIDRDYLINLLKNTRTKLLIISDLYFHELNISKLPNMVFYRNFYKLNDGYFIDFDNEKPENLEEFIKIKREESSFATKLSMNLKNKGYEVYYYGLPNHDFHKQARRIFKGYGNRIYIQGKIDELQIKKSKTNDLKVNIDYIDEFTVITVSKEN